MATKKTEKACNCKKTGKDAKSTRSKTQSK